MAEMIAAMAEMIASVSSTLAPPPFSVLSSPAWGSTQHHELHKPDDLPGEQEEKRHNPDDPEEQRPEKALQVGHETGGAPVTWVPGARKRSIVTWSPLA
jgi:hypothetical protein